MSSPQSLENVERLQACLLERNRNVDTLKAQRDALLAAAKAAHFAIKFDMLDDGRLKGWDVIERGLRQAIAACEKP